MIEGRSSRDAALTRYAAFNDSHRWKYEWMLRVQKLVPRVPPRLLAPGAAGDEHRRLRPLVVRPLPEHLPARDRRPGDRERELAAA